LPVGRRYVPFAFTERGAVMLARVLNSPVAVAASIQVVRAFVQLRGMLTAHTELARRWASSTAYGHCTCAHTCTVFATLASNALLITRWYDPGPGIGALRLAVVTRPVVPYARAARPAVQLA